MHRRIIPVEVPNTFLVTDISKHLPGKMVRKLMGGLLVSMVSLWFAAFEG